MPPLVVGLRNPGPDYSGTRHNVGLEILEIYAERRRLKFKKARLGIRADVAEIKTEQGRQVLAVPRTFMNESGQAVAPLLRYYRTPPEEMLVLHDDIDLPFGRIRYQFGRGAGGHNGVSSLIKSVKTNDFWRLKFGVGRPPGRMDPADFVLKRFNSTERPEVDLLTQIAADSLDVYLTEGAEAARQFAGERTGKAAE